MTRAILNLRRGPIVYRLSDGREFEAREYVVTNCTMSVQGVLKNRNGDKPATLVIVQKTPVDLTHDLRDTVKVSVAAGKYELI
jgi:hypothetical protein